MKKCNFFPKWTKFSDINLLLESDDDTAEASNDIQKVPNKSSGSPLAEKARKPSKMDQVAKTVGEVVRVGLTKQWQEQKRVA